MGLCRLYLPCPTSGRKWSLVLVITGVHVTDIQGGLDIETVGKHRLVTGAQPASPEITLVTVVFHVSIPFLKHKGDIDISDIHLAAMGVQPEEPVVEEGIGPVTELRLDKPVTELLFFVQGRRGVPRVEKEIHAHLCAKGPFTPHGELQGEVGRFQGIVGQIVLQGNLLREGTSRTKQKHQKKKRFHQTVIYLLIMCVDGSPVQFFHKDIRSHAISLTAGWYRLDSVLENGCRGGCSAAVCIGQTLPLELPSGT